MNLSMKEKQNRLVAAKGERVEGGLQWEAGVSRYEEKKNLGTRQNSELSHF